MRNIESGCTAVRTLGNVAPVRPQRFAGLARFQQVNVSLPDHLTSGDDALAKPFTQIRSKVVNDITAGNQAVRSVDVSPTGDVLVSWFTPGSYLQVFDANGNDVSPEVAFSPLQPAIWLQDGSFATLNYSNHEAWIDRYDRTGVLLGSSAHIAAFGAKDFFQLSGGEVVLVYDSGAVGGHLAGQRLDANLQPVGS